MSVYGIAYAKVRAQRQDEPVKHLIPFHIAWEGRIVKKLFQIRRPWGFACFVRLKP